MNGKILKALRKTHFLTQVEISQLLNVKPSTYAGYESGKNPMPKWFVKRAEQLVDLIGYEEKYLLEGLEKVYVTKKPRGLAVVKKEKQKELKTMTEANTESVQKAPHAEHYGDKIDVINWAEENLVNEELIGFYRINAIKYVARFGFKDGFNKADLDKAKFYINKLSEYAK